MMKFTNQCQSLWHKFQNGMQQSYNFTPKTLHGSMVCNRNYSDHAQRFIFFDTGQTNVTVIDQDVHVTLTKMLMTLINYFRGYTELVHFYVDLPHHMLKSKAFRNSFCYPHKRLYTSSDLPTRMIEAVNHS